jgi:hypothetical protein
LPKKLSFAVVKKAFEDKGYKLLEKEYNSKDIPMKYKCPKHPNKQTKISYNSLRNGSGCPYCRNDKLSIAFRLPLEKVVKEFETAGYELLTTDYKNASEKLAYRCPRHPELQLSMSLSNLKSGKRCKACRNEEASERNKTPFNEIKKLFEERSLELLETNYRGKGKLKFKCPRHPNKPNSITLAHLKHKKYCCPYCARTKVDYDDVKRLFKERYCELLEEEYVNDKKKMRYRCLYHPENILTISYDKFRSGQRGCSKCSGRFFASYEEVKLEFDRRGYELLETDYKDSESKLAYLCPFHPNKVLYISYQKLKNGRGCRYCAAQRKAAKYRFSYDEVQKEFKKRGYELIEKVYLNNATPMRYRCYHHKDKVITITLKDLKNGKGCPYCFNEQFSGGGGSAAWKGGISSINDFLRAEIKDWTKESLRKYGYKCAVTLQGGELEVHHTKSFYEIRDEVLKELNLFNKKTRYQFTKHELNQILFKVKEKHTYIIGVPLKGYIHRLFHKLYGRKNNTMKDFEEFKKRYINGEFEEILS